MCLRSPSTHLDAASAAQVPGDITASNTLTGGKATPSRLHWTYGCGALRQGVGNRSTRHRQSAQVGRRSGSRTESQALTTSPHRRRGRPPAILINQCPATSPARLPRAGRPPQGYVAAESASGKPYGSPQPAPESYSGSKSPEAFSRSSPSPQVLKSGVVATPCTHRLLHTSRATKSGSRSSCSPSSPGSPFRASSKPGDAPVAEANLARRSRPSPGPTAGWSPWPWQSPRTQPRTPSASKSPSPSPPAAPRLPSRSRPSSLPSP